MEARCELGDVNQRGTKGMRKQGHRAAIGSAFVTAVLMLIGAVECAAQTSCVGFSAFQALTAQQVNTLQVRVAPVGAENKVPPALAFTFFSNPLDPSKFTACEAAGVNYESDNAPPFAFLANTSELQAVISNTG